MLTLNTERMLERPVIHVQEEPSLELALPQVFAQPPLTEVRRGKLPHVEALVARIYRSYQANPSAALGLDYQVVVNEFQPLFAWAMSCWDFLVSREGCRFVPRSAERRRGVRGDYQVVTYKDFSRLVHGTFRLCVLEFAQEPHAPSLAGWVRERLWPTVAELYRRLENPPDPRQRTLTAYSYLRCIPYQFLNDFHHEMVYTTLTHMAPGERRAIEAYFLHFCTETTSADVLGCSREECGMILQHGLVKLLLHDRLVYCLLRQIERY